MPQLDLSKFPRFPLLDDPTPIQYLPRLSKTVGVDIYVKRDDFIGIAAEGNKLRKLEFLIADALAQGADTIITLGARQSNHCRLTAAAANRAGLKCELVLKRSVPRHDLEYSQNGNILLDEILGAHIHDLPADADLVAFAETRKTQLEAQGRKVYVIPVGGSNALGSLGYADCAREISEQTEQMGLHFDQIFLPSGSAGTHAGLVAGFAAMGQDPAKVLAFTISNPLETLRPLTFEKANQTAKLIHPALEVSESDIRIDGGHIGSGYGIPTDEMLRALRLLATTEGLLLDPVYSGKAFAGMLYRIEKGEYHAGQKLLFLMTGGLPGLFAYRSAFTA